MSPRPPLVSKRCGPYGPPRVRIPPPPLKSAYETESGTLADGNRPRIGRLVTGYDLDRDPDRWGQEPKKWPPNGSHGSLAEHKRGDARWAVAPADSRAHTCVRPLQRLVNKTRDVPLSSKFLRTPPRGAAVWHGTSRSHQGQGRGGHACSPAGTANPGERSP
jgi:hypothetical protein